MDNHAQVRFVALPPGPHTLLGCPGGGKTTTLLRRVARLVADDLLPREGGFLLLSFSKDAAEELRSSGERLFGPDLFNRNNTCTLHALSRRLAASAPDAHPLIRANVGTYVRYFLTRLTENDPAFVASVRAQLPNLRAVFVDEAQDLCAYQNELIQRLANALGIQWVEMIGDQNQNIYEAMQGSSSSFLEAHAGLLGGQLVRLRTNFRSTPPIVRFANAMRPSDVPAADVMVPASGAPHGTLPIVTFGSPMQNVLAVVERVKALRDAGEALEGIAVLGMVRKTFAQGKVPTENAGLTHVANLLSKAGVPLAIHYYEVSDGDTIDRAPAAPVPGHVNLLTTHSSKGLAWRHVLVLNFNQQAQGFEKPDGGETGRLLYVAVTRARLTLALYVNVGPMNHTRTAPHWRLPDKMPPATMAVIVGDPGPEVVPPLLKERDTKIGNGNGVKKFLGQLFRLNGGELEYKILCGMANVGGLRAEMVTTFPPAEPCHSNSIHHNDFTILGKVAELLAHRAFCAARMENFELPCPVANHNHNDSLIIKTLCKDSRAKWEFMTRMLDDDPVKAIVNHCYYEHQLKHEALYRLSLPGRRALMFKRAKSMQASLEAQGAAFERVIGGQLELEKHVERKRTTGAANKVMYTGFVDACSQGQRTLCEFKFSKEPFAFKDVMQLVLYAHTDNTWVAEDAPLRLLLWNLRLGQVQQVFYDRHFVEMCLKVMETYMK